MLKLRFLFNNEDLASMILGNWRHDPDSKELFRYFRISSNAVYPFRVDGKVCFLRFAPVSEKLPEQVSGELEFIEYLKCSGYNSPAVIPSVRGNLLETVKTPWGEYEAAAFEGVPGRQLEGMEPDDAVIYGYGRSLGRLHKLSADYCPKLRKRWSWRDALDWMQGVLSDFPEEGPALKEVALLKEFFSVLPTDEKNYGLVHYDFEPDNVFFEKEKLEYHVIDFDDAMYHWFAMDVGQALESMAEDMEPSDGGMEPSSADNAGHRMAEDLKPLTATDKDSSAARRINSCFIEGYRSQFGLTDEMLALLPVFRRFAKLYGYVRILRSIRETVENEPEWMTNLRKHLEMQRVRRADDFGKALDIRYN